MPSEDERNRPPADHLAERMAAQVADDQRVLAELRAESEQREVADEERDQLRAAKAAAAAMSVETNSAPRLIKAVPRMTPEVWNSGDPWAVSGELLAATDLGDLFERHQVEYLRADLVVLTVDEIAATLGRGENRWRGAHALHEDARAVHALLLSRIEGDDDANG